VDITISNCEKIVSKQVLDSAYSLYNANKVISVTNVEVNEHLGSLYEGKIRIGKKVYNLCFAIDIDGTITIDDCFCNNIGDLPCEHFLAVFLYMKYTKNIIIDKRVFSPVRVILASAEDSSEGVNKAVDTIINRYIQNGKISEWYMFCAIEGLIFACMCAESEENNFVERIKLYCVAFSKVDKLFCLSKNNISRMLINQAKGLIKLSNNFLMKNTVISSNEDITVAYEILLDTSKKVKTWVIKYNIMGLLVQFCELPLVRASFEKHVKKMIYNQTNDDKKSDLRILYCMILRTYSLKLASSYIEKNISDVSFRRMAIDLNIANGEFKEAKRLAREGLVFDKGNEKNTLIWIETMYDIGKHSNEINSMKTYAKKLLLSGDFDYYNRYKALFKKEEWDVECSKLISSIKSNSKLKEIYLQIIIEENNQDELLAYCKSHPEKIANYYPYINNLNYKVIEDTLNKYCQRIKNSTSKDEIRVQKIALKKIRGRV
jgi:hypothetical protein